MRHGCKHISIFIFLFLACTYLHAQVSIKATVNRDNILIGEPISLTVDAYVPSGVPVAWFPADSIPHFYVMNRSAPDTSEDIDGKRVSQLLTLTSFDSGRWQIPAFEVIVGGKPYYSDTLSINVAFLSFNSNDDYRDIKDIAENASASLKYIPWIVAVVAIIALLLFIFLWRKRKRPAQPVSRELSRSSAYEDAIKALTLLRQKGVGQGGEKAYYSAMNDILRNYVSKRFDVSTFERTNEELIVQLSEMKLPKESFSNLARSLRMSDFVKFAKYRPSDEDNRNNLDIVRSSIDLLNMPTTSAV